MRYSKIKQAGFSADSRLLRNQGYEHVLCAEKIVDKQLKIFFSTNAIENSRLGIVASKRNFSRAVDRNKIKRVIREAFRQHAIKASRLDLVVLVNKAYSGDNKVNIINLGILFDQIKIKCASQ